MFRYHPVSYYRFIANIREISTFAFVRFQAHGTDIVFVILKNTEV